MRGSNQGLNAFNNGQNNTEAGSTNNTKSSESKEANNNTLSKNNSSSDPLTSNTNNKSNNSGFASKKSGLFSGSNKSKDEVQGKASATEDFIKKLKKAKMIMAIVSAVTPIVFPIIVVFIIVVIIMAQIMTVRDNIVKLADQFTTGVEKLVNFAQGDGWMTNEDSFFKKLDNEYDRFETTVSDGGKLDIPLIAATIHYSATTDLSTYEDADPDIDSNFNSDNFFDLGINLTKDQTVSFYKVSKDKLGSVYTLWPGQKRLLGHVVNTSVELRFGNLADAASGWSTLFSRFENVITDTMADAYWQTPIQYINPLTAIPAFLDTYNRALAYQEQMGSISAFQEYNKKNLLYECQEFVYTFRELFNRINGNDEMQIKKNENDILEAYFPSGIIPYPYITTVVNYGHGEYQQMKEDILDIKALLKKEGIDISNNNNDEVVKKAQNSSNDKLKALATSYNDNKSKYMYSYTHYLQEVYIPFTYFYNQNYTQSQVDTIVEEIYDQRDFYNYLITEKEPENACGGSCSYPVNGQEVDSLKVRLLTCSNSKGIPIPGEELIDFEKYILGVVYAEIGPSAHPEALKVQAIAARSYALLRPGNMNNAAGLRLQKENGNWVLSIRNCVADQVYCDPDKGCSTEVQPTGYNMVTVYSGATTKPYSYKGPLPEDAAIRSAVSEVAGQVLLNKDGNIVSTGYVNTNQNRWDKQANEGKSYTEILMSDYKEGFKISSPNCSNVCNEATGDYTQWKQAGAPWSNIVIGNGQTIGEIGCLVTSVSIQMARSGVPLTIPNFNPGTFVEAIRPWGFSEGVLYIWDSATKIAPNFVYGGQTPLSGMSKQAKASTIQGLINSGCYVVMEVKSGCGGNHWVAVDYVSGDEVYMMDPSWPDKVVWDRYNHTCTTSAACYRVTN